MPLAPRWATRSGVLLHVVCWDVTCHSGELTAARGVHSRRFPVGKQTQRARDKRGESRGAVLAGARDVDIVEKEEAMTAGVRALSLVALAARDAGLHRARGIHRWGGHAGDER